VRRRLERSDSKSIIPPSYITSIITFVTSLLTAARSSTPLAHWPTFRFAHVRLGCPTIYGFHPHSKYPMGIFLLLSGSDTDSSLQDVTVAQSSLGKFIPTIALVTALYGEVIDATKGEIKGILKRGKDVGLFPGGQREMIYCKPGSNVIPIVKHIGFLRVAMEEGSTVTPTFTFGFNNSFTSIGNEFDMWCFEKLGSNLPFWMPTGLWGGSEPRMVVGKEVSVCRFAKRQRIFASPPERCC